MWNTALLAAIASEPGIGTRDCGRTLYFEPQSCYAATICACNTRKPLFGNLSVSFAEPAFGRCHQHIALYPIYISLLTSKYQAAVRRVETHWRRQWAASPRSTDRSVGVYLTSNLPDASVLQIPPSWLKALPSWEDCPLSMHFLCVRQSRIGARNKGTAARQGLVP